MARISNPQYVIVSPDAIRDVVSKKGTTLSAVSRMLGYQDDFLSNSLSPAKGGSMLIRNALAICAICGCELEDITLKESEEATERPLPAPPVDYTEQLNKIIFRLAAINSTLAELVTVYRQAWIDKE